MKEPWASVIHNRVLENEVERRRRIFLILENPTFGRARRAAALKRASLRPAFDFVPGPNLGVMPRSHSEPMNIVTINYIG